MSVAALTSKPKGKKAAAPSKKGGPAASQVGSHRPAGASRYGPGQGSAPPALAIDHEPAEREAETAADLISAGKTPPPVGATPGSGFQARVQRSPDPAASESVPEESEEDGSPVQGGAGADVTGASIPRLPPRTQKTQLAAPAPPASEPVKPKADAPKPGENPADLVAALPENEMQPGRQEAPKPDEFPQAPPVDDAGAGGETDAPEDMEAIAEKAIGEKGSGEALDPKVRGLAERGLGADFSSVRVHTDAPAQKAARGLRARAFTHQNHIWLAEGESPADVHLMAHELAHVVQQGAAPIAKPTAANQKLSTSGAPEVQPGAWEDIKSGAGAAWDATGGWVVDKGAELFWDTLEELAPSLVPIVREISRKGIITYLGDMIEDAVSSLFQMAGGENSVLGGMFLFFTKLWGGMSDILKGLMSGDCKPLLAAVRKLKDMVTGLAGEAWDGIVKFFTPIGDFFADLWTRVGLPVWDWLKKVGGEVWEFISNLGKKIWKWTEPVRDAIGDIWGWVKDKLGIGGSGGGSASSEGGIVNWIKDKAGAAWGFIKAKIDPVIAPIKGVWEKIKEVLPLKQIADFRDSIKSWLDKVGAAASALEKKDGVTEDQASLREDILPALLERIKDLRLMLVSTGLWLSEQVGGLIGKAISFFTGISRAPLLHHVSKAWDWMREGLRGLRDWVSGTVIRLFTGIGDGLVYLSQFIEPILDLLSQLVGTITNLMGRLADLVLGATWRMIPGCIRDPIKNFIVNQILKRIPFFGQFVGNPEIWAKMRNTAMRILKKIFVDGDLAGAAWSIFKAFLRLFNLPPELVTGIITKAVGVLGDILLNPFGFLINLLRAVKQGFVQFFGKIGEYLLKGVTGWLFGEMKEGGLEPPEDLSLKSILKLVVQILDITMERVFKRLEEKIGKAKVDKLRKAVKVLTGVWEWVSVLIKEGPSGLWKYLTKKLSNLWNKVLDGIIAWVRDVIITQATLKIMAFLDITGIMPVINGIIAIYKAIQSFMKYLRQMLEIVNKVLDGLGGLAKGAIEMAANFLESALGDAMPVAMGFLANQAGLHNVGKRIRDMVEAVREVVDKAIDWLIDKALKAGAWIWDTLKKGAGAVKEGIKKLLFPTKKFSANGESHEIWVSDKEEIMVSSVPQTIPNLLKELEPKTPAYKQPLIASARATLTEMRRKVKDMKGMAKPKAHMQEFLRLENQLAKTLQDLISFKKPLKVVEKYKLEGMVAPFKDMPKIRDDEITPDHQPQAALFRWAKKQYYFKNAVAGKAMRDYASDYKISKGVCINLSATRHEEGRTFGLPKGANTKQHFVDLAEPAVKKLPKWQDKRNKVVTLMKLELNKDIEAMKAVVARNDVWDDIENSGKKAHLAPKDIKKIKETVKKRILEGESRIAFQDLEKLKGR